MKIASLFGSCAALVLLAATSLQSQTVTGSGAGNTIPVWTSSSKLGNSLLKQSGTTVTVNGKLEVVSSSGDSVDGLSSDGVGLNGFSTSGFGVYGAGTSGIGVFGGSTSNYGVQGSSKSNSGVYGQSNSGSGVYGQSSSGSGVHGESNSNIGVVGVSNSSDGVSGTSTSGYGVTGTSTSDIGVFGVSGKSYGVKGSSTKSAGVYGESTSDSGVDAVSTSGYGIYAQSDSNVGAYGLSTSYVGVWGQSTDKGGVVGESVNGDGMGGIACNPCSSSGPAAVVGIGALAGSFGGDVIITDSLQVAGAKLFHIDHPLDPANKYLNHFSVESNEILNTYSGNVTTDGSGTATVQLPDYFEALNKDYRYQLTVIGQFAQAIVSEEIHGNRFTIRTDKPSVRVSWQVSGLRSDAYVKAHPIPVEEIKPEQERGYYLSPEVFGQPQEKSLNWLHHPALMRESRAMEERRQAQAAAAARPAPMPSLETSGRN